MPSQVALFKRMLVVICGLLTSCSNKLDIASSDLSSVPCPDEANCRLYLRSSDEVIVNLSSSGNKNKIQIDRGRLKGLKLEFPAESFSENLVFSARFEENPIALKLAGNEWFQPMFRLLNTNTSPALVLSGDIPLSKEIIVQIPELMIDSVDWSKFENMRLAVVENEGKQKDFAVKNLVKNGDFKSIKYTTKSWSTSYLQADTTKPSLKLSSKVQSVTNAPEIDVLAVWSESVVDFSLDDIELKGATIKNFTGEGNNYIITLAPNAKKTKIEMLVKAGAAFDLVGQANTEQTSWAIDYDASSVQVKISSEVGTGTGISPIPITITFDKPVNGLNANSFKLSGAKLANLKGSGSSYSLDLLPNNQGLVSISLPGGLVQDRLGNGNEEAKFSCFFDTDAPVVTGNNLLTIDNTTFSGARVSWTKATDAIANRDRLQYRVYYSTSNNLGSVALVKSNGKPAQDFTVDISNFSISGLNPLTTYYVNVLVRDESGQEAVYASSNFTTLGLNTSLATASAPQRKTFRSQGLDWLFWSSGQDIRYATRDEGFDSWTEKGVIAVAANSFAVFEKNGQVFLTYEFANDIYVQKAQLSGSKATWDEAILAFDSTSFNDFYRQPVVTVGNDGAVYVAALKTLRAAMRAVVRRSVSTFTSPLTFSAEQSIGPSGGGNTLALIAQGSRVMAILGRNHKVEAYKYNGTSWDLAPGNVHDWFNANFNMSFDKAVSTIAVHRGDIYVGGQFNYVDGIRTSYLAKWDGHSWSSVKGSLNGTVLALAVYQDELYMSGNFSTIDSVSIPGLAKWNGTSWSGVGSVAVGSITGMKVYGNDLYAWGSFTSIGGVSAAGIAKWNGTNWSSLGTSPGTTSAVAFHGSNVYVGGSFVTTGGVTYNRIAKWDGSSWSTLGTGLNAGVNSLAIYGSDLYVAGSFTTAGGTTVTGIAKWDGSNWSAFAPGLSGSSVSSLLFFKDTLYAGGNFTTASSNTVNYVAQWTGSTWQAMSSGFNTNVSLLTVIDDALWALGSLTAANASLATTVNRIAKWDGSAWLPAIQSGTFANVYDVAVSGSDVYVGGQFTTLDGMVVNNIAKWNGTTWAPLGTGVGSIVRDIEIVGTDVYVGGQFTTAGGISANRIAKWDGTTWSALGGGVSSTVYAIAAHGGDIYAGGAFSSADGVTVNYVAKWDGSAWSALGTGVGSSVNALLSFGGNLIVGGGFSTAGGSSMSRIAAWNGSTWSALGSGVNSTVNTLAASGSDLYVGGSFSQASSTPAANIAKWDGSTWSALGAGVDGTVFRISFNNGDLYAGGSFTTAGGSPAARIAKWNGSTWSTAGTDIFDTVQAIGHYAGTAYVGTLNIGLLIEKSNFVARASHYAVTPSHNGGVNLVYVDQADGKPYYAHYDTTWSAPTLIDNTAAELNSINIASKPDTDAHIVSWIQGSNVYTVTGSSQSWNAPNLTLTQTGVRHLQLPESIGATTVPLVRSTGINRGQFNWASSQVTAP